MTHISILYSNRYEGKLLGKVSVNKIGTRKMVEFIEVMGEFSGDLQKIGVLSM